MMPDCRDAQNAALAKLDGRRTGCSGAKSRRRNSDSPHVALPTRIAVPDSPQQVARLGGVRTVPAGARAGARALRKRLTAPCPSLDPVGEARRVAEAAHSEEPHKGRHLALWLGWREEPAAATDDGGTRRSRPTSGLHNCRGIRTPRTQGETHANEPQNQQRKRTRLRHRGIRQNMCRPGFGDVDTAAQTGTQRQPFKGHRSHELSIASI